MSEITDYGPVAQMCEDEGLAHYPDMRAALLGQGEYWDKDGEKIGVLVYSVSRAVEVLVKRDGMSPDEALEFIQYNYEGAYMGPHTPVWVYDIYE